MAIYKRCDHCGRLLQPGKSCGCIKRKRQQEYDQRYRDRDAVRFYNSAAWQDARTAALERDCGIDRFIFSESGEVQAAETVHHITPLREDWSKALDMDNLISVSDQTHKRIHKTYDTSDGEKLRKKLTHIITKENLFEGTDPGGMQKV